MNNFSLNLNNFHNILSNFQYIFDDFTDISTNSEWNITSITCTVQFYWYFINSSVTFNNFHKNAINFICILKTIFHVIFLISMSHYFVVYQWIFPLSNTSNHDATSLNQIYRPGNGERKKKMWSRIIHNANCTAINAAIVEWTRRYAIEKEEKEKDASRQATVAFQATF